MQARQESEFDLFCKTEKEIINIAKQQIEVRYELYESLNTILAAEISPFHDIETDDGQKRFAYFFAALLKADVDYAAVYKFGATCIELSLNRLIKSSDSTNLERQTLEKIRKRAERSLRYSPLIAEALCTYDELKRGFKLDEMHPLMVIMSQINHRFQQIEELEYSYKHDVKRNEDDQVIDVAGFKAKRDALLTKRNDLLNELIKPAALPPETMLHAHVTINTEPMYNDEELAFIRNLMLQLSAHELQHWNQIKTPRALFALFPSTTVQPCAVILGKRNVSHRKEMSNIQKWQQ
jgi:hypothetical protein